MSVKSFFSHWIVRNLLWAVIVIFALVFVATICLSLVTQHGKELTVPDFTNMTVAEAVMTANAGEIRVEVTDSVYVRKMARGVVYRQNPAAGSKVKKGRRIMLTINSVQPKKVAMPNLIGLSMRQARAELSSRGLTLGRLLYVDDIATNNVLRQIRGGRDIVPGTMVASGTTIDLEVGLNPEQDKTYVPSVIGMKFLHAIEVIHTNSLNAGELTFDSAIKDYGDSLDAVVYKQDPDPAVPVLGEDSLIVEGPVPVLMGSDIALWLSPSE